MADSLAADQAYRVTANFQRLKDWIDGKHHFQQSAKSEVCNLPLPKDRPDYLHVFTNVSAAWHIRCSRYVNTPPNAIADPYRRHSCASQSSPHKISKRHSSTPEIASST